MTALDPDSEIFQPVGLIFANDSSKTRENWPENEQETNPWIWIDDTNDGQFQADGFQTVTQLNDANGWYIGPDGDIWMSAGKRKFQTIPLSGTAENGIPSYQVEDIQSFSIPDEFKVIKEISYLETDDLLYLGGLKPGTDRGAWKSLGDRIVCYKNWSSGRSKVKWKTDLSWDTPNEPTGLTRARCKI